MSDALQMVVVTTAAAGALFALVRPYVQRSAKNASAPCANCSSSRRHPKPSPAKPVLVQVTRRR